MAEEVRRLGDRPPHHVGYLARGRPLRDEEPHLGAPRGLFVGARVLVDGGIRFELNAEVGRDVTFPELQERHDAIFIGTGVYRGRDITLPGVGLANIVPALDYLTASNRKGLGDDVPAFDAGGLNAAGKRVVVVGGGDTAMDCVRTAVRQGAKSVQCLYRRDRANMPGSMREVRHGVWHWQSPHPGWSEEEWWPELVSSYGIELGDDFVLFDPLSVPDELRERATAVVLTAPYHERDARRLGLPVHTPPADTWEDWVEKFGIDPDRVRGMESEDLAWLRAGEGEGHFHGPGAWPFGITAYAGREDNDLILWLPSINAIVTGDSLSDFGDGLDIQLGGRKHVTREEIAHGLRPLLDLPVELVLPAHGEPLDRAALERVLS